MEDFTIFRHNSLGSISPPPPLPQHHLLLLSLFLPPVLLPPRLKYLIWAIAYISLAVLSKLGLDGSSRGRSCTYEGNGFFVELVQTTKRETRFDRPPRSTGSLVDSLTLLASLARPPPLRHPSSSLFLLFLPYLSTCLHRGPSLLCTSESRGFPRVNQVIDFLPDRFVEPRNEEERRGA